MKCKLCGSEINEQYNYCLYCGKDIIVALDDDYEIPFDNIEPYHENLMNKIESIELKTYKFDGTKCYEEYILLGNGRSLFKNYVYTDHFIRNKPDTIVNISLRINKQHEMTIPILVPITLKPLNIGIQISDNYRLRAIMDNQYASSTSSLIDLFDAGEIKKA